MTSKYPGMEGDLRLSGGKLRNEHIDTASKLVDKTSEQIRLISLAR